MRIDVYPVYTEVAERDLRERTLVMMDVLRAGPAITAAVQSGAEKVIPMREVSEAIALSRTLERADTVLAGEREGLALAGFDTGSSPLWFTPERAAGKTVVMTTANGTAALTSARITDRVLVGSLVNRAAVAEAIVQLGQNAAIICAGTDGRFSADDIYGAGAVLSAVRQRTGALSSNDVGVLAELFYEADRAAHRFLMETENLRRLLELGCGADVEYCFREDSTFIVPVYFDGYIGAR